MKTTLAALLAGLLFGAGLALSGMTQPDKVLAFLDLAGRWDPTLAFVMGSALLITVPGFALTRRRAAPLFETRVYGPPRHDIDPRLGAGAVLFGIVWGIAGYCPGPALASLVSALPQVFTFCAAMLAGMWLYDRTLKPRA